MRCAWAVSTIRGQAWNIPLWSPSREDPANVFPYIAIIMALFILYARLYRPVSHRALLRMCLIFAFTGIEWLTSSFSRMLSMGLTLLLAVPFASAIIKIGQPSDLLPATDKNAQTQMTVVIPPRQFLSSLRHSWTGVRQSRAFEFFSSHALVLTFFCQLTLIRHRYYVDSPIIPFKAWLCHLIWYQLVASTGFLLPAKTRLELLLGILLQFVFSLYFVLLRCVIVTRPNPNTVVMRVTLSRLFTMDDTDLKLY